MLPVFVQKKYKNYIQGRTESRNYRPPDSLSARARERSEEGSFPFGLVYW